MAELYRVSCGSNVLTGASAELVEALRALATEPLEARLETYYVEPVRAETYYAG